MRANTLICLHGYGVRGGFFRDLADAARENLAFDRVSTPDMDMSSLTSVLESAKKLVSEAAGEDGGPVAVLGHSLGAVAAATVARDLGVELVESAVMIAAPYGERKPPSPLVRFLLRHRLIPDSLARPSFFGPAAPKQRQKELFAEAVPETPELQEQLFRSRWFHTDFFTKPLPQAALFVYSEADRIVPPGQTADFARVCGGRREVFARGDAVGHDDFVAAPPVIQGLVERLRAFYEGLSGG
jgi:pimeloyl-ACP methyl ester carboxylesterase